MAGQDQLEPATQRGAVDGGDHRLRGPFDEVEDLVEPGLLRRLDELGSVGAGDERLARAPDDDGVDGGVPRRHHDPLLQALAYPVAEHVVGRVVDGNDGNVAATLEVNELSHGCHGRLLCRRRLPVRLTMHSALAVNIQALTGIGVRYNGLTMHYAASTALPLALRCQT